ncbi:MAG: RuBisCO operon transcriptional regulator [Chloroflexi bacterium]|nr:RuBisCO operon transcriptional regulator [Chloroflexota bacterium]
MSFTLHQLEVFRTVATLGSYTRAAEELHIAQPAISAHISALQTHLGVRLFARQGRGISITEAGSEFLTYADSLLRLRNQFESTAADILALRHGELHVAASTTAGIYVVPPLLGEFHRSYPDVHVSLQVANRHAVMQRVLAGDVELGVLGFIEPSNKVIAEPFLFNELIVVAAPTHHLASAASTPIPLSTLAIEPFLIRERGSGTRADTEVIFARAKLPMRISQELGSTGAIKVGVLAGLGIAVLPRQAAALHLETGELVELSVEGFPVRRSWHLVRLVAHRLSPAAAALREGLVSPRVD